jgi:hypothetical protein
MGTTHVKTSPILRPLAQIHLPASVSPTGSLAAFVLEKILEISRIFLRFFPRARSRANAVDETGLGTFICARGLKRWTVRILGCLISIALLIFYFGQYARFPPNAVDGALLLGYLEDIYRGNLPYWNFIDVYGPLNWIFPYLFYRLANLQAWGVQVWMIVLKIISIGVTVKFVHKLGNGFYAFWGACVSVVLLGQPWQLLQTPYASHTSYPLVLIVWYLVLYAPFKRQWVNVLSAGILTAIVLWTKLNTGLFLFAAGLFYYFYWAPIPDGNTGQNTGQRTQNRFVDVGFGLAQFAGLFVYGVVFFLYISGYFNFMYFLYLGLPMLICLGWTLLEAVRSRRDRKPVAHHVVLWLCYLIGTSGGWLAFFLGYFGLKGGLKYLSEQANILTSVTYALPFLPPGAKSYYQGFSTYYWLQLPWLATALFCVWLVIQRRSRRLTNRAEGQDPERHRMAGLWAFFSMHAFCIYPRSDEAHMYQAIIATVPVLFVIFYQIESVVVHRYIKAYRTTFAFAVALVCSTMVAVPSFKVFADSRGDWYGDRLRYLKFRPTRQKGVGNTSRAITDHNWDIAMNRTAICVDHLTYDGEEVLVLTSNQMINYQSKTRPFGGGYRYLFYLLNNDFISREKVVSMIPAEMLKKLLLHPPRVIVSALGRPPMIRHFPELGALMDAEYEVVQNYAHKLIYLPKKEKVPKGICGPFPESQKTWVFLKMVDTMSGRKIFRDY